jgi:hypothetical protein
VNKIVAFLQQSLDIVTKLGPQRAFPVALIARIRNVPEESSQQTQIPFILMGTGQNFISMAQPANKTGELI